MRTHPDCVACLVRQAADAGRMAASDAEQLDIVPPAALRALANADLNRSPPEAARLMHEANRTVTGLEDAYEAVKRR